MITGNKEEEIKRPAGQTGQTGGQVSYAVLDLSKEEQWMRVVGKRSPGPAGLTSWSTTPASRAIPWFCLHLFRGGQWLLTKGAAVEQAEGSIPVNPVHPGYWIHPW
jgi:hypothetical protein